ncbi:Sugar efflux transporter for intercellular exchange [Phytophthora infestans]|uniref:Sugar efflux transporter for intercellular exchange n=1 Tax=Phytophthora infestans TaxID=4787 RepID=A0A833TDB3_PHYIN|nr:Sugar efflux transporter for intercellular exchange [Phytophthora infestans]KAF4136659.1 Sugar efflux transporter for intercellular exchange [Phytophthora infestans]
MTGTAEIVVRSMAACSGAVMILSPSILIYRVSQQKDVGVASVIPLVTLFSNCHIWALYGYMIENWFPIFWIYFFGDFVALAFLSAYWKHSRQRRYVNRVLLIMACIVTVVTVYAIVGGLGHTGQSRDGMGSVMGIFADISAICMYGAPMEKLLQVLKYRYAAFINAHMVIAGLTNNCLWFTYGILSDNWFIISPNIVFISLNTFTLVLCVVFDPKTHPISAGFHAQVDGESDESPALTASKISLSCKGDNMMPSPAFEAMHSPLDSIRASK